MPSPGRPDNTMCEYTASFGLAAANSLPASAGELHEVAMIDVERPDRDAILAIDEARADVMRVDLDALDGIHLVHQTDPPIFGEGVPQARRHGFGPRRA